MKKKVLLVVRWPVGGIRTFLGYVFRNFDAEKWEFTILAPDLKELRILNDDLDGINVSYVYVPSQPTPASFFLKIFKELFDSKYDLVHSHGFTSGTCATLPAMVFRIPHIMTSHDVINPNQFVGWKGILEKYVIERLFNLIDNIHSVSHDAQENLLKTFPFLSRRKAKLIVIPNGIDVKSFIRARPRDLRSELGLNENVFLIGFLGRFMSQKGFRYLVEAIELLIKKKNLSRKPLVATFGEGAFIREEKQALREKNLQDHFVFMPFTPDVAGTIKGLDVVVMPSLWEACSLLAMETLVCGVPLIATDCIGLREVIKNTPARRVPVKDGRAISTEIEALISEENKNYYEKFIPEACSRFDVAGQSKELEKLYEKMTERSYGK